MTTTTLQLPLQPDTMTPAQLAAVSYLARYSGHTHRLYAYQGAVGSNGVNSTVSTRCSGSNVATSSSTSVTSAVPD